MEYGSSVFGLELIGSTTRSAPLLNLSADIISTGRNFAALASVKG